MEPLQQTGPTPQQQQNLANSVNQPITLEALKPQANVNLPSAQPDVATTAIDQTQGILNQVQAQEEQSLAQQQANDIRSALFSDIPKLEGEGADLFQAQQEAGSPGIKQEILGLNSRILQLQAETGQDDIQLAQRLRQEEQRDTLRPFALAGQAQIAGDAAIYRALKNSEIGVLNARALAKQGELALANQSAQQAVDTKYAPYKERINTYKSLLELIQPQLTADENKQLAAQNLKVNAAEKAIAAQVAQEKDVQSLAIEASRNGASGDIVSAMMGSGSISEAIEASGGSLSSNNTQVISLENGNTLMIDSKTGKTIRNFGGGTSSTPVTGGSIPASIVKANFGSVIKLAKNLETTVSGKKSVEDELNNMLSNEDYAAAYNQITNTVQNNLTGETKTRFTNARVDVPVMKGLREAVEAFDAAGGDTGLLKGKPEQIKRRLLGITSSSPLSALAVQLEREFQTYRNIMTGAAFTPEESREYAAVNPSTNKRIDLNLAIIDGALNQLENRVNGTIETMVGGSGQIRELANVPVEAQQSEQTVNEIYANADPDTQATIEVLFENGSSDADVIEYLQLKGLI